MKKLRTVLLVDDDDINNFLNTRLLKRLNVADEIKVVSTGEEAIKCLNYDHLDKKKLPELVLLDINMPGMSGFEFMESCNSKGLIDNEQIYVAALSTSVLSVDKEKMERFGVKYYLSKPLTENKILGFLKDLN